MAEYLPRGPLSAYLGVRNTNEAADMEKFGLLARLQQAEQARRESEAFRRDQLTARVEGQREAIASREGIAADLMADRGERERQRAEDARRLEAQRAADIRERQEAIERLRAQLRPPPAPHPVTTARIVRDGREVIVDARTGAEIGEAPPRNAGNAGQISPENASQIVATEGAKLKALIGTNPRSAASLLSPMARGLEAARGIVDTNYSGPALDAQAAKQRLLFAVDQLVKSGKSSNEFLRRLETALGMQGVTAPQNAIDAIDEAIKMTSSMSGGLPPATPPPAPKPKSPSEMTNDELLRALSGG